MAYIWCSYNWVTDVFVVSKIFPQSSRTTISRPTKLILFPNYHFSSNQLDCVWRGINTYLITYFRYQFQKWPAISLLSFRQRVNCPIVFVTVIESIQIFFGELAERFRALLDKIVCTARPIHSAQLWFRPRLMFASPHIHFLMLAHIPTGECMILEQYRAGFCHCLLIVWME